MKFCGSCGAEIDENAFVCFKCGDPQRSVVPQGADSSFGFKPPGEYDGPPAPEQQFGGIPLESAAQPTVADEPAPSEAMEKAAEVPGSSGEHACETCSGTLIFSLARGVWFCPGCGTEAPSIPPPFADEEPDEDEAMQRTQELLSPQQPVMPAGPLPTPGEELRTPAGEKPPEEVGGIKRKQATDSILEIQNLIEAKSKQGLYSMDAETGFESMKLSFTQNDYPAVMQLNGQVKDILENAQKDLEDEKKKDAGGDEALPPGGIREQAINDLNSAMELIAEAERLGYDMTESKKIFKQAEPAYRAGDYRTAINFAHDVEGSVNAVLGGKRLAKAPTVQPRYPGDQGAVETDKKPSFITRHHEVIFKFIIPIAGLVILILGASIAYISYDDGIWNPFSDGPDDWGPYNTTGVILGIVAVVVGILFAILPFFLTKKVYVRMEQPKPVQMQ